MAKVWAGAIDDLWKLGKPKGEGGPWKNSDVRTGVASDPYLIAFYDERTLSLSHDSKTPLIFNIEVEPLGHGPWMTYRTVTVQPGKHYEHRFPDGFQARWIRFSTNADCKATAWLKYE